jgi:peptidoglycan/xylan/chitin deacetylase (PgdA/CDA1 family)
MIVTGSVNMHPLSLFRSTNLVIYFHVVPSIDWFRSTLRAIKSIYKFISIEDIESYYYNNKEFNNCCHICFDDGDRSIYENAFPVLKEMNIPATLFVSPKVLSDGANYWFQELHSIRKQLNDESIRETICEIFDFDYNQIKKYMLLSIIKEMKLKDIFKVINTINKKYDITVEKGYNITHDQLIDLYNSNIFTIGAHTMNHPILSNETNADSEKEIHESIEKLSEILDTNIKYFSYPNGVNNLDFNLREQKILKEKNIKLAFSTDNSFFNDKTNPISIPRIEFSDFKYGGNSMYILSKLFTVPRWQSILTIVFLGKNEIKERIEIKKLSLFN